MPADCRIDFYVLADTAGSAGQLACRLSLKAWEQGHRVAVLAGDAEACRSLDKLMWDYPPQRFLPHERGVTSRTAPVCIVDDPDEAPADSDVAINLSATGVPEPGRFRRLLEIVPADNAGKAASRAKYRHYRQLGLQPETHQIQKF